MKIRTISKDTQESIIQALGYASFMYSAVILFFQGISTTFDYYVAFCYITTIVLAFYNYMTYNYKEYHFHLMYMSFWLVMAWSFTKSTTLSETYLGYIAVFLSGCMLISTFAFINTWKAEVKKCISTIS